MAKNPRLGPTGDVDVELVIKAKTEAAEANLTKLAASTKKAEAEAAKLAAQTTKLDAETKKLSDDAKKLADAQNKSAQAQASAANATTRATTATSKHSKALMQFRGDLVGAIGILRQAGGFIDKIAESQVAAGQGTDIWTRNWLKLRKAMEDPKFLANVSDGLADVLTAMDPFLSMQMRIGQGFGDHRRGVGFRNMDDVAEKMLRAGKAEEARNVANATAGLLGSQTLAMKHVKEELADRKAITKEIEKQANVLANSIAVKADQERVGAMQRAGKSAAFDDELLAVRMNQPGMDRGAESAEMERTRLEKETELREFHHKKQQEMREQDAAALLAYQEQAIATGAKVADALEGVTQAWMATGDMSSKGLMKALRSFGKQETIRLGIVALRESILALAAAASFNIPQATAHGAAAAKAAAGAIAVGVMTGAAGGFSGGGSGSGGGTANGPGSSGPAAPPMSGSSSSQADKVPTSPDGTQVAQSGGGAANSPAGGVSIGAIHVTGAIDDMTAMKIYQAMEKARRRLGKQSA